jgi:hypothetical protein
MSYIHFKKEMWFIHYGLIKKLKINLKNNSTLLVYKVTFVGMCKENFDGWRISPSIIKMLMFETSH